MVRKRDSFWAYAEEIRSFKCKFCQLNFPGGISRFKSHLSGVSGRDIQICEKVPDEIQLEAKQALQLIAPPTKRTRTVAASNDFHEGQIGSSSSHMPNPSNLDKQFFKLLISNGIRINAVRSPLVKNFVNGVAEHGPGYELPSDLTVKSQLISDIKKEVAEYIKNILKSSVKTGYTLMCYYLNFKACVFVCTPVGVVCLNPPNDEASDEQTLSQVMVFTKPANVVQFIMNDQTFHMKRLLDRKYPWICQTRCATLGIRLLLERLCNLPFVHNILEVSKWIVSYFYKHKVNVSLRRVHRMKRIEASYFFTLISLLEVESELQALQTPIVTLFSGWEKLLDDNHAFRVANFIGNAIHCKTFWSRGKMVAQVMRPLFQTLSLVHCYGPTSGYLYEMMERVQDVVKECCGSNQVLYEDIRKILNEVRSDIIHPIHAAAAFLNPIYMLSKKFEENAEMTVGVNHILEHLVPVEEKEAFKNQVELYRRKHSELFTAPAMMMLETSHPRIWWELCGIHLPVLQKYAIQILSQPCSSTLCNRHYLPCRSKLCNPHDLRDSEYCNRSFAVNVMMMERYKSLETQMTEPIILDQLGEHYDDLISQDLWDEDNYYEEDREWDEAYGQLREKIKVTFDQLLQDPIGSWLDYWPMDAREESE